MARGGDALRVARTREEAGGLVVTARLRVVGALREEMPLQWRREDGALRADVEASCGTYSISVRPDPVLPRLALRAAARYRVRCAIAHESVTLGFDGADGATVLGRDMRTTPMRRGIGYLTDRWTPLEVAAGSRVGRILVDRVAGFDSAVSTLRDDGLEIRLEMDDAGNHPFSPYSECVESYSPRLQRNDRSRKGHFPGESATHSAEIWFGEKTPLRLRRLPEGRTGALVFTSHADQSRLESTRAVLWGHSDKTNPLYGTRGIASERLGFTLCAWARDGKYADLADASFHRMLSELDPEQVEICAHSTTKNSESREAVDRLLPEFAPFKSVTWIDHEPETNCEAINNAGASTANNALYIRDILARHGFRYVWVTPDQVPVGRVNLLEPGASDSRTAFLYPLPRQRKDDAPLWAFRTVWRFLDRRVFFANYSDEMLDRLSQEDGIQIAHVYIDTWQPSGKFAQRSLLEADGSGLRLRDDAARMFARLAKRQEEKHLWVTSVRHLADHLTGLLAVRFEERVNGDVVVHGGKTDLFGVSISIPLLALGVTVDGSPPSGIRSSGSETTFWFDLPAGSSRLVHIDDLGRAHPLESPGEIELR